MDAKDHEYTLLYIKGGVASYRMARGVRELAGLLFNPELRNDGFIPQSGISSHL